MISAIANFFMYGGPLVILIGLFDVACAVIAVRTIFRVRSGWQAPRAPAAMLVLASVAPLIALANMCAIPAELAGAFGMDACMGGAPGCDTDLAKLMAEDAVRVLVFAVVSAIPLVVVAVVLRGRTAWPTRVLGG